MESVLRVLVCDDEAPIRYVIVRKLREFGCEVVEARNGEDGLAAVRERGFRPALVITDFQMPMLSGLEMAAALREHEATRDVPVLMLTARGYVLTEAELSRTNIREVISKPFGVRNLLDRVRAVTGASLGGGGGWREVRMHEPDMNAIGRGPDGVQRLLEAWRQDRAELADHRVTIEAFSKQLTESFDTIELLYSLGRSMRSPQEPMRFLELVVERLSATLPFDWMAIVLDPALPSRALAGRVLTRGDPPGDAACLLRETACLRERVDRFPSVIEGDSDLSRGGQMLADSVTCKGEHAGFVLAGGKHGEDPMVSSYDLQLVEATTGYVSAFVDTVALWEDQRALFVGTVKALTAAIDAKDRYTFGHSERVAWMGRALARDMGLSEADAERVHIAGLVHDVGKIGVPEAVLTKPGKLTDDEFAMIRMHPTIGNRILEGVPLLEDVLPGVLHHHERWDGRGYPYGLAGEDIPRIARVLAVADTFDAMSSNRSYRPALSRAAVLAEIGRSAGTQLDPDIAALVPGVNLAEYDAMMRAHAAMEHRDIAA